jgi:hypothetical protein
VCAVVARVINPSQRQWDRLEEVKALAKRCDESLRVCEYARARCER